MTFETHNDLEIDIRGTRFVGELPAIADLDLMVNIFGQPFTNADNLFEWHIQFELPEDEIDGPFQNVAVYGRPYHEQPFRVGGNGITAYFSVYDALGLKTEEAVQ